MNRISILQAACLLILSSCNPAQEQRTQETADSLQREMEQEMDTATQKIDSLGDTLKDATNEFLDEAGKTLEKAGEKLKEAGN
ncbi:hypothetical protein EDD80_101296 [Anseongella ginsenosidimutans]|uniref:Uncharacterized protein n=1 Tax=Anseongella ginsenosidimutans TaxID=496056 RepID=A0A4R3KXD0_9SPHI|nr:hypothetical protein [Anseongella ginsenosidimutans]QEC51226.1 hypothetical protein FRZ59_01895 [Anseongella ginsenosidimutans]TCS90098.1 hypothetical protein EDD80_101296 [Anseongella ginsenosidimutans]